MGSPPAHAANEARALAGKPSAGQGPSEGPVHGLAQSLHPHGGRESRRRRYRRVRSSVGAHRVCCSRGAARHESRATACRSDTAQTHLKLDTGTTCPLLKRLPPSITEPLRPGCVEMAASPAVGDIIAAEPRLPDAMVCGSSTRTQCSVSRCPVSCGEYPSPQHFPSAATQDGSWQAAPRSRRAGPATVGKCARTNGGGVGVAAAGPVAV